MKLYVFFILVFLLIGSASAMNLRTGVILNTSISNSAITFNGFNITANTLTVSAYDINLTNIVCSNGKAYATFTWNVANMVNDSFDFCNSPDAPTTGGSGGGGGSATISISDLNISKDDIGICKITYEYIQRYGYNLAYLQQYQEQYDFPAIKLESVINNWQPSCSDVINRSLKEKELCNSIYFFLTKNNNTYDPYILGDFKGTINPAVSLNLLKRYISNYDKMCKPINGKALPFKPKFLSTIDILTEEECNPDVSQTTFGRLLDYNIKSVYKEKEYKCSEINFYKWFLIIEKKGRTTYQVQGIRIYWILSIIFTAIIIFYAINYTRILKLKNHLKKAIN